MKTLKLTEDDAETMNFSRSDLVKLDGQDNLEVVQSGEWNRYALLVKHPVEVIHGKDRDGNYILVFRRAK